MARKRIDIHEHREIHLGCGRSILCFFAGIILLIFALGFFVFWFIPFLLFA